METISSCNSEAIVLLKRGDARAAAMLLKGSIASLRSMIDTGASNEGGMMESSEIQTVVIPGNGESDYSLSEGIFTFFPQAFEIPTSALTDIGKCGKIVLYNMALTFDIQAQCLERKNRIQAADLCARRAICLYKNMLRTAVELPWDQGDSVLAGAVLLAAANNLGRLQSRQHCFQETREALLFSLELYGGLSEVDGCPEEYLSQFDPLSPFLWLNDLILPVAPSA